ncbi:hypothetical protein [Streptomyces sp. NBC_01477]|uniref:hypothetical protein n=1 Tax=Streptomyces sp. NBC_01477 TaxID=2976015 RepID=UPI002E30ABBD|nr:hypothetical protein [Streptomyces sp. NBC_01477]
MADELDDRLRELARNAELLVVLAGPQAARRRGERRRTRRRAACAGMAAALALTVCGWQLEARRDSGATAPASGAAATREPSPLRDRLVAELLPADALPYSVKWRWSVVPEKTVKAQPPCDAAPLAAVSAQATRAYLVQQSSAAASYRLYAFPDAATATGQSRALRKQMQALCGIGLPQPTGRLTLPGQADLYWGTSKEQPGVAAWVESQGPYVAVLFVTTPGYPESQLQDSGVAACIAASLARLAVTSPPVSGGTGKGAAAGTAKADARSRATAAGDIPPTATC